MIHKHPFFGQAPFSQTRRGYHHGRLKDALIEAARALIAEHGPAGFTLAEAAKRVGVTGAAPYRHFADRNELIGELARRGFELFGERLAGAWDEGRPDARAALKRMGRAYLGFATAEPGLYSAMFNEVRHLRQPLSSAAAGKAFEGLGRAAAAVLADANVSPAEVRRLAFEIWALSHGTAMLALAGHLDPARGDDAAAILEQGAEALIDGALKRARA
ncbi:MAG: TetR/AcrR family transcriptional regulator [Methylovirgula sp.]